MFVWISKDDTGTLTAPRSTPRRLFVMVRRLLGRLRFSAE
jgi:hypothetical protein